MVLSPSSCNAYSAYRFHDESREAKKRQAQPFTTEQPRALPSLLGVFKIRSAKNRGPVGVFTYVILRISFGVCVMDRRVLFIGFAFLFVTAPLRAGVDALAEVNATRAVHGLAPFIKDASLTAGAINVADFRAARLIEGHTANDFGGLPTTRLPVRPAVPPGNRPGGGGPVAPMRITRMPERRGQWAATAGVTCIFL